MKEYTKNLGKVVMTPKGAWSIEKEYEILDIVHDSVTDHAYVSKQEVPSGVDLSDSRYWMPLNVSGYSDSNVITLNSFNEDDEIQSYTLEEAIKVIKDVGRKSGAILIFYNDNVNRLDITTGCWEIWQFNSINVYDWENLDAWVNVYYNYNKFVGWYAADNTLNKEIPNPDVGCYAFVGNIYNEAFVYRCDVKNRWTKTNQKAQYYIKVVFGDNVIIGDNGNWWQDGIDTNIPVSVKGDNGLTPYLRWSKNNQIEYSYDNTNWYILSDRFNTNIKIKGYVRSINELPNNIELGTIYGVGPTYSEEDVNQINPIYIIYVYSSNGWINNGGFNSISAGVVQERGTSITEIMSQAAVNRELLELKSETNELYSGIDEYPLTSGNNYYRLESGKTYTITNNSNFGTNIGYYPSIEDAINDSNYKKIVTLNGGETYTFVAETNASALYLTKDNNANCFIKKQTALDIELENYYNKVETNKLLTELESKSYDISKAQENDAQIIGSVSVNLNDYSKKEGAISSNGAWNKDGYNRYHIAIPIVENTKRIIVKTNAEIETSAAIVKTYSETAANGTALDFAMGQARFMLPKNSDIIIDCPYDGKYLIITINSNTSDATPQNVGFSYGIIELKTNVENTISLLDKSRLSFPGYVDTNGIYQPAATTYKCTDFILLNPKSTIRYQGELSNAVYAIAVYDENKNFSSIHSQLGNRGVDLIEYCNNTTSLQYVRISCKIIDLPNTNIWIDNIGIWAIPYSWDYGNIGTEGEIIEPITNNRLHSTLIPIDDVDTISCDENQTLGYVLYDEDRNLVARYVAGVSELDIRYLALRYKDARYISVLIRKVDNSNYDIASESPYISIIKGEVKTFIPQTIKLTPKEKLPVIIFNFDDCDLPGDYEVVKLFESRGVRCGFAFVATEEKLNNMSDVYLDFQKRGFDIMNHSGTVDAILTSNYSFNEAKDLIVSNGLEKLQKKGFIINGFVCPNSQLSNDFLPIVAKTHAYNMLGQPYGSNSRDADINKLVRYSLENNTIDAIKNYIDDCIANDKCLIFYAHTVRFGNIINNELFDLNKVAEILDYVIEKRNNLECWVGGTDEGIKYYFDL